MIVIKNKVTDKVEKAVEYMEELLSVAKDIREISKDFNKYKFLDNYLLKIDLLKLEDLNDLIYRLTKLRIDIENLKRSMNSTELEQFENYNL